MCVNKIGTWVHIVEAEQLQAEIRESHEACRLLDEENARLKAELEKTKADHKEIYDKIIDINGELQQKITRLKELLWLCKDDVSNAMESKIIETVKGQE
jgi:septal ring factor EnvC (AmiA/AmiB activator)